MKIHKLIEEADKIKYPHRQYDYLLNKLVATIVIAFCAIIYGEQDYEDVEDF